MPEKPRRRDYRRISAKQRRGRCRGETLRLLFADAFSMSYYPVLLFHSTDDRDLLSLRGLGNIRPELFEKFIVRLKKEFDIVGLSDMIGFISGDTRARENPIAITFDDGPRSYASQAVPILQTYGVPSTCFLITDCLDDREIYWRYFYNYCIQKGSGSELAA